MAREGSWTLWMNGFMAGNVMFAPDGPDGALWVTTAVMIDDGVIRVGYNGMKPTLAVGKHSVEQSVLDTFEYLGFSPTA